LIFGKVQHFKTPNQVADGDEEIAEVTFAVDPAEFWEAMKV
jgi:hypothetical protein